MGLAATTQFAVAGIYAREAPALTEHARAQVLADGKLLGAKLAATALLGGALPAVLATVAAARRRKLSPTSAA